MTEKQGRGKGGRKSRWELNVREKRKKVGERVKYEKKKEKRRKEGRERWREINIRKKESTSKRE